MLISRRRMVGLSALFLAGCGGSDLPTAPTITPDYKPVAAPPAQALPKDFMKKRKKTAPSSAGAS